MSGPSQGEFKCLYQCGSDARSTRHYHVYSDSASTLDLPIPPGEICDRCDEHFSKLEQHFNERHPGSVSRVINVPKTKKGKAPRMMHENGELTRTDKDELPLRTQLGSLQFQLTDDGEMHIDAAFTPKPFDPVIIGRVIAKAAFESTLQYFDNEEWSTLDPRSDGVADLRNYARWGPMRVPFIWFAWKVAPGIPQHPPHWIGFQDEANGALDYLCLVSYPEVAYLIPSTAAKRPAEFGKALSGWNLIDSPQPANPSDVVFALDHRQQKPS